LHDPCRRALSGSRRETVPVSSATAQAGCRALRGDLMIAVQAARRR
ncbi:DUF732 domain-containing protein, partial [Klebsiella pneumoniae]